MMRGARGRGAGRGDRGVGDGGNPAGNPGIGSVQTDNSGETGRGIVRGVRRGGRGGGVGNSPAGNADIDPAQTNVSGGRGRGTVRGGRRVGRGVGAASNLAGSTGLGPVQTDASGGTGRGTDRGGRRWNGRAGRAGRGRGRGRGQGGQGRRLRDILAGLSPEPVQTTFERPSDDDLPEQDIELDAKYIGSYNWMPSDVPTIVVPGCPREWADRPTPYDVKPDSGRVFVDQNANRSPASPLVPLFLAVDHVQNTLPMTFDWSDVDIVTDRNGLRKLIGWCDQTKKYSEFRIDLQLAGKTVLFTRWEARTSVQGNGTYGFNFEHASTRQVSDCEETTGHHRIITYDYGGLKLVVRYEVDACLGKIELPTGTPTDVDDLTAGLGAVIISEARAEGVVVRTGGDIALATSPTIEMTTKTYKSAQTLKWKNLYPQLFLGQTPHFFLALHDGNGRFQEVKKSRLDSDEMRAKGESDDMRNSFKRLRLILQDIKELTMRHGEDKLLTLVCRHEQMQVFERTDRRECVPNSLLGRFKH